MTGDGDAVGKLEDTHHTCKQEVKQTVHSKRRRRNRRNRRNRRKGRTVITDSAVAFCQR